MIPEPMPAFLNPFAQVLVSLFLISSLLFMAEPAWTVDTVYHTLSGLVTDSQSGEPLPGANVYPVANPSTGTLTDTDGSFELSLPEGKHALMFSYLGYREVTLEVILLSDTSLIIRLEQGVTMKEVVVSSSLEEAMDSDSQMGRLTLTARQISELPVLMGEVDLLKALQLLPGVMSSAEGNSGFSVRGGGADQNLVLLDEAVVYNTGHLLGFFSVFHGDAIDRATLYKGGMPARYGGRLSSVVDIRTRDGNSRNLSMTGGIGLLASRLTLEGPVFDDRTTFLVSGRRTYAFDLAQPFLKGTAVEGTNYFFHDVNAKVSHRISRRNRLRASFFSGRDVLDFVSEARGFSARIPYGNTTGSLRWDSQLSDHLFLKVSGVYTNYSFSVDGRQADFSARLRSGVRNLSVKTDIAHQSGGVHEWRAGAELTAHTLTPDIAEAVSGDQVFTNDLVPKYAREASIYVEDEINPSPRWQILAGLRATWFAHVGPYPSPDGGSEVPQGSVLKSFAGLDPRLSMRHQLSSTTSIKASAALVWQYLHLVSNSTNTLPFDVWVPSSRLVDPQRGMQYAIGAFYTSSNGNWEASAELYYRDLFNQLDYRENYVNDPTVEVEQNFVSGRGRAYGAELLLRKRTGDLTGWMAYTYSRSVRWFEEIENGRVFPSVFDRPHDLSLVLNYQAGEKWRLGFVFVYGSGRPFTPVKNLYLIEQNLTVNYGPRNSSRLNHYHRADLSATWTPRPKSEAPFSSSWTFSIYNLYSRQNPLFFYTAFETNLAAGTATASAYKVSLFPIIPSVTWNFTWNQSR